MPNLPRADRLAAAQTCVPPQWRIVREGIAIATEKFQLPSSLRGSPGGGLRHGRCAEVSRVGASLSVAIRRRSYMRSDPSRGAAPGDQIVHCRRVCLTRQARPKCIAVGQCLQRRPVDGVCRPLNRARVAGVPSRRSVLALVGLAAVGRGCSGRAPRWRARTRGWLWRGRRARGWQGHGADHVQPR